MIEEWTKKEKCQYCLSLLLVEQDDINYDISYGNTDNYKFKCPVCGMTTNIRKEDLTLKVRLLAAKKYLLSFGNN